MSSETPRLTAAGGSWLSDVLRAGDLPHACLEVADLIDRHGTPAMRHGRPVTLWRLGGFEYLAVLGTSSSVRRVGPSPRDLPLEDLCAFLTLDANAVRVRALAWAISL